jgi:transcriptional regulator with XRE-family HTH domain
MIDFKKLMKEKHLTFRKLGELTGVNFNLISQYTKGQIKLTFNSVIKLATCLELPITDLMYDDFKYSDDFINEKLALLIGNFKIDSQAGLYSDLDPKLYQKLEQISEIVNSAE